MKKHLFLVFLLFLFSCNNNAISISDVLSSEYSFFSDDFSVEESISCSSENDYEYKITYLDEHVCKIIINNEEIVYKADKIINGIEYTLDDNLYLVDEIDTCNFIVINGGKLIINETTIVKKGETYNKNDNTLKYGLNASILVIGENSNVKITNSVINVFSSYSSAIHCLEKGSADVEMTDILIVNDNSHVYSILNDGVIISKNILTLSNSSFVKAFTIYENGGKISIEGESNYIELYGDSSLVCLLYSGYIYLSNIYGYSSSDILFDIKENADLVIKSVSISKV